MDQQFQNNPINNSVPQNGPPDNLPAEPVQEIQTPIMAEPVEPFIPKPISPISNIADAPQIPTPPAPSDSVYRPPVPNFASPEENGPEKKKKPSMLSMIIAILAVIVIVALAFLLYYFITKSFINSNPVVESVPTANTNTNPTTETPTEEQPAIPEVTPTNVITFSPPAVLPTTQKSGNCWTASIAYPYRQDAFRCAVGTAIYDPCFKTTTTGLVYCQMNPTTETSFVIKLTKALPTLALPATVKDNWAWFLTLSDGTICSPFTGTKPTAGGQTGFYGCKSQNKNEQVVLMGDLTKGDVWTAQKYILEKQGTTLVVKSSEEVELQSVWQ